MNIPKNHNDQLPIREEMAEGIPFRVCFIQMEDFKRCADKVFSYMMEEDILLNIQEPDGVSTFLCTAAIYEWLKENNVLDQNEKVSG